MLKFVMIIMVPFAQGHDRHEPPIACAAFGRIRAVADIVAKRIVAESAVLKNDNACDPAMRKARVMPAWERIRGHEAGAQIFPKLLKKKYLDLFS